MKKTISVLLAVAMIFSLCACSQNKQSGISIKPTEFSEETLEVLDLFDDEIQFFDISLDENVKSFEISVWVYRDGEWFEDGKTHGNNDFLGKRIAIRLTENSYELYNISDNGHEKYSYPSLDTPFEESMGIGYSKIDREIPIELNKEIPIRVKIGTTSNRKEVLDKTEEKLLIPSPAVSASASWHRTTDIRPSVFLLLHLSCCSFLLSAIRLNSGNKMINMCRQQRRNRFFFLGTVVDTV